VKLDPIFAKPTSTFLWGDDRSLLNWVAYGLASVTDPEFTWTDIRFSGQVLPDTDPLTRNLFPAERLNVVRSQDLAPDEAAANMAVSAVIRPDEAPDDVQRLLEFLRLPANTQEVLARPRSAGKPRVAVLSNGQRIVAFYPSPATIDPTIRAIVGTGTILIMTFADAGPDARFRFENVLNLEGSVRDGWRTATLAVEKGAPGGSFVTGTKHRLAELSPLSEVLARELG
jgi:hypothetical protein